jgi:hypothetical protein
VVAVFVVVVAPVGERHLYTAVIPAITRVTSHVI